MQSAFRTKGSKLASLLTSSVNLCPSAETHLGLCNLLYVTPARAVTARPWASRLRVSEAERQELRLMTATNGKKNSRTSSEIIYIAESAPQHCWEGNQEGPRRVNAILKELEQAGISTGALSSQLRQISEFEPAAEQTIQLVHTPEYVRWLAAEVQQGVPKVIADPEIPEEVTYVTPSSYQDATRAAGAACRLVDEVMQAAPLSASTTGQQFPVGFSIARPPGHHAGVATPSGFCLLNNVAIASRHAQHAHGLKRVLIFDFDVHCGNGTVDIFCDDPGVMVIDMHEDGVWPHTGHIGNTGQGAGKGATVDIPLPVKAGHRAALAVFDQVIAAAARKFEPQLILVSAGYDAHWRDPLAQLSFQSATYHLLAGKLKALASEVAGGRLVFLLEGGYSSEGLASSVAESFLALLDQPSARALDDNVPAEPSEKVNKLIQDLKDIHKL